MSAMDPNQQATAQRVPKSNPAYTIVSSFGNGTACDQNDDESMLPFQVSYDDSVNPKYPGR